MPADKTIQSSEEARARLAELQHDLVELRTNERTDDYGTRAQRIWDEATEYDQLIEMNELFERRSHATGLAATQNHEGAGSIERRSGAELMLEADTYREWLGRGAPESGLMGGGIRFGFDAGIRAFEQRADITEFGAGGPGSTFSGYNPDGSGAGLLLPLAQPQLPVPRQARIFMRDLMPVTSTTFSAIPYVQELTPVTFEAGVTGVPEGVLKPAANVDFTAKLAQVCTLATTIKVSKQMMADGPAVISYLNGRLPYLVKLQEDYQLLNGLNNNYPDLPGLLNQSGIATQAATPSQDDAAILGNAFAQVELNDGAVTAVVMNPTDAWHMFTKRAASGAGTFDAGTPFNAIPMSIWGVPTYRTRAKAAGNAVAADFQHIGQIFDRQQINMAIYNERFADTNQTLLVVEERLAVAWYRPDLAVSVTLNG